jgi:hypothetical protein
LSDLLGPGILRQHRPLLLAMEALGWLHMTGKARVDFLRFHGGQLTQYNAKAWKNDLDPS